MFDSGVCFTRLLYYWKTIYEIYKFIVIGFEKFLTYSLQFSRWIYGTLLAAPEKTMPQLWAEELGIESREVYLIFQLVNA